MLFPVLTALAIYPSLSSAVDFSIPVQWANISSSLAIDKRVSLAQGVIDTIAPRFDTQSGQIPDLFYGQNANMMSALALHDWLAASSTNHDTVTNNLQQVLRPLLSDLSMNGSQAVTNDPLMWGLTAIYAYRAYKEKTFLDDAIAIWDLVMPWAVTQEDADRGSHPLKNVTLPAACNGTTIVGGVFYNIQNPTDLDLAAGTQGAFMALTAYLLEATNNQTYSDAARLSNQLIQSIYYDSNEGYVQDTLHLVPTCEFNELKLTYDSGLYLEGLSTYANTTNNLTLANLADEIAASTMKTPIWTRADGVIIEFPANDVTPNTFGMAYKGMLIRGLYQHWLRRPADSDIAKLIESFIMVQYNSLLGLARAPVGNIYSPRWDGPPVSTTLPWGQLAAVDVLNSAMGFSGSSPEPNFPSPSTTAQPTETAQFSPHHEPPIGMIVGIAVGGSISILCILGAVLFVLCRRNKRRVSQRLELGSPPTSEGRRASLVTVSSRRYPAVPFSTMYPIADGGLPPKMADEIQQMQTEDATAPPSESENSSSYESIEGLIDRLNMAIAQLPPAYIEEGSSVAPPQYQSEP